MACKKILVADDNRDIVDMCRLILKKEKFQVIVAYDGDEALEKAFQEKPDLILLDVMMPKMDGFKVCESLRGDPRTKDTPIVMLTMKDQPDDKARGLGLGADEYLTKPLELDKLLEMVKERLSRH